MRAKPPHPRRVFLQQRHATSLPGEPGPGMRMRTPNASSGRSRRSVSTGWCRLANSTSDGQLRRTSPTTMQNGPIRDAATRSYGRLPHHNAKAVSVVGRDLVGCSTTTLERPEASAVEWDTTGSSRSRARMMARLVARKKKMRLPMSRFFHGATLALPMLRQDLVFLLATFVPQSAYTGCRRGRERP